MKSKAIYPGSFDPFTNGHMDIVKKASLLFDEVFIVIGVNANKRRSFSAEDMAEAIRLSLQDEGIDNCIVDICNGLIAEYAKEASIRYMIRGLRNNMDYNYEENIAEVNKLINPEMEYVYFRAENVAVSSSMVKELHYYGQSIAKYLPTPVYKYITSDEMR